MSNEKQHQTEPQSEQDPAITFRKLVHAEKGAEVLFGLARTLEQVRGKDDDYAYQLRRTAHAIRDITDDLQHWVSANTIDPELVQKAQIVTERDSATDAYEHQTEIARRLRIDLS